LGAVGSSRWQAAVRGGATKQWLELQFSPLHAHEHDESTDGVRVRVPAGAIPQVMTHHGMAQVRILVTGGTFDKEYDELGGRLYFKHTHVPEMLERGRCLLDVVVDTIMMIDSLELADEGRREIVERCRGAAEHAIVITHGTDTMAETAAALGAARLADKTIVLTGAMVPYAFGSSDGLFNLGSALSFVQVLPPGVYVAMNGQHFRWDRVRKNRRTGVFEPA
jgi:L-asparaginase